MPAEIEWLDNAKDDLPAILNYIAADRPRAAVDYIHEITASVSHLELFPETGKRFNRRYRVLVVRQHLIFYKYLASRQKIVIAAVIDARRDVAHLARQLK